VRELCASESVRVCERVYLCVGAEESTATHAAVDAAVSGRLSISSGGLVGAWRYLRFLSLHLIFLRGSVKSNGLNPFSLPNW